MTDRAESRAPTAAKRARIGWKPASYDRMVASSRLRTFLPCEHLRRAGWDTAVVPPGGEGTYDCVVFQKAYANDDLALVERLKSRGVKTVFDLCDDHFYNPRGHPKLAERAQRLERMLHAVDAVSAAPSTLADLVAGPPTFVVDDALEVPPRGVMAHAWQSGDRVLRRVRPGRTRLVWFGNSGSLDPPFGLVHLAPLLPALERLNRGMPLELTVMSNSRPLFDRYVGGATFPTHYVRWRHSSFARRFACHDICVIPVEQNPFTVAKTSNRLVLSLMLGVPVVASPIPSYEEFSAWVLFDNWEENLLAYARYPGLGQGHVGGAQEYIARTYTPQRVVDQWGRVLSTLLG
jgi:hypothetical protein